MTEPDQRLERAVAAFARQEFGAPVATIIGLTEIMIEDARRIGDDLLASDLGRIHSAGLLLQEQVSQLVDLATHGSLSASGDPDGVKAKLRHDLRTPLNAIKGYSELIIEAAREDGRQDLLIDTGKLLDAAEQLLGQIDKLVGPTGSASAGSVEAPPLIPMPSRSLIDQVMRSIQPINSGWAAFS